MLGLLSSDEMLDISDEQWFRTLKYFFTGYEKESPLLREEKQAVPFVMQSIELLFVAWFLEQNDTKCAEDAMKIYRFVEKNQEEIFTMLHIH